MPSQREIFCVGPVIIDFASVGSSFSLTGQFSLKHNLALHRHFFLTLLFYLRYYKIYQGFLYLCHFLGVWKAVLIDLYMKLLMIMMMMIICFYGTIGQQGAIVRYLTIAYRQHGVHSFSLFGKDYGVYS